LLVLELATLRRLSEDMRRYALKHDGVRRCFASGRLLSVGGWFQGFAEVDPRSGTTSVRQRGLFDLDDRYRKLSEVGDPLVRLAALVDFEVFRSTLTEALDRSDRSKGGRPPYDAVLMFKVLVLQTLYTLSDDAAEFQLRDRLSFMRFLGLGLQGPVPRRHDRRRAPAAPCRRREEGDQGRPDSRGLERQAGQARRKRPRRALDIEARQGATGGRGWKAESRDRHSGVRL
jgi:hypothetical protein